MDALTLVLVRHGTTAWSDDRYMGRTDVPLDDNGHAQATALVGLLAGVSIDALWCSPLARARQTAAPLAAARRLAPVIVDELAEMHYGSYQGRLKREHRLQLKEDHVHAPIPGGGESLADLAARADAVLSRLAQLATTDAGGSVVVVGHYRVHQFLYGRLCGQSLDELVAGATYKPANGSAYSVRCRRAAGGTLAVIDASHVVAPA